MLGIIQTKSCYQDYWDLQDMTGKDWPELNMLMMKFYKVLGIEFDLYTDAKGVPLPHVDDGFRTGDKGATVELTIDLRIQKVVESELLQAMEKFEATQALAIVMNPKTGELLSVASFPTFHPSEYQQIDPSIYNRNLPVWMTFEPGSTFKIITLAASIRRTID